MIRNASVYTPSNPEEDGLRVLIMRRWPRGIRRERIDTWLKDAAPSAELLTEYNRGDVTWDEFERRYRAEILDDRPHVLDELRELAARHGTLTLLCHERIPPDQHCHRLVLQDLLGARSSG